MFVGQIRNVNHCEELGLPCYWRFCGLKVLFVVPHVFAGGAEKALLNLAHQLNLMSLDVTIAALSSDLTQLHPNLSNLTYLVPPKPTNPANLGSIFEVTASSSKELLLLARLIKRHSSEFDVVCVGNFPSYWAVWLARAKQPLVWFSSEVLAPYNQTKDLYNKSLLFRIALRFATTVDKCIVRRTFRSIVTCSPLNSRMIKSRYGLSSTVLPTGVDYEFFHQTISNPKAQLGIAEGVLLLHVGALVQRKNQILSIRALKALKPHLGNVKLALVGEGPWLNALKAEAQRLGLAQDVVFFGGVAEEKLRLLYNACDVNLFPVKDQTWGLVPFEALAAGKPSVITRGAGAAEVIEQENIGFLIDANVEEIAASVLFILSNPKLVADVVARGQLYIQKNLTWTKYAQDVFNVFKNLSPEA